MVQGLFLHLPSWLSLVLACAIVSSPCEALSNKTVPAKVASAKHDQSQSTPATKLQISDAWVRLPPPGSQVIAIYLTIANHGATLAQLSGVQVEGAMTSDLHETSVDQTGISSMRIVSSLDIPPGESKSLSPGGLHVMVMGLNRHLREGDQLSVNLLFKDQPSLPVSAVVRP